MLNAAHPARGRAALGVAVLKRSARLTSSVDFARTVRHGSRAGTPTMVLHLDTPTSQAPTERSAAPTERSEATVGFVVSKAVGPAVTRNRVKRRLRHIAAGDLALLPESARLVVRAQPAAAGASYDALRRDFESALGRATRRRTPRTAAPGPASP